MEETNSFIGSHRFYVVDTQLENSIEDYARHLVGDNELGEYNELEELKDTIQYDEGEIVRDLEHLSIEGFLDKKINNKGEIGYALTEEAAEYLADEREMTEEYLMCIRENIGS